MNNTTKNTTRRGLRFRLRGCWIALVILSLPCIVCGYLYRAARRQRALEPEMFEQARVSSRVFRDVRRKIEKQHKITGWGGEGPSIGNRGDMDLTKWTKWRDELFLLGPSVRNGKKDTIYVHLVVHGGMWLGQLEPVTIEVHKGVQNDVVLEHLIKQYRERGWQYHIVLLETGDESRE